MESRLYYRLNPVGQRVLEAGKVLREYDGRGRRVQRLNTLILLLVVSLTLCACQSRAKHHAAALTEASAVEGPMTPAELNAFTSLDPIDSHTHVFATDPGFISMLKQMHLHLIDIVVYNDLDGPLSKNLPLKIRGVQNFIKASHGHASLCTTFNPFPFAKPGFAHAAIAQLNRDFVEVAIAVKIWKNMGMEVKDARGNYVMPDNSAYEPIYRDIAAHNKTLIAHLAEPDSCWKPLDPSSPDYEYYKKEAPQWYMYGKAGASSKAEILRARDRLVAENPRLRVVGAHLGSLESNFSELGRDFDRYPNFAVDTAARIPYIMMLPREQAIAFLTKYQDRMIYGTDLGFSHGESVQQAVQEWENYYARDWRFLATDDWVEYQGKKYQGLDLPRPILEKIYHANAARWFPGVLGGKE
jgi:predicted TIM-barrel fold metal-dependent hydrolase